MSNMSFLRLRTRGQLKIAQSNRDRKTYLGKASKQYVFFVSGKATLMPDVRGE